MSNKKELHQYYGRAPKSYRLAHNHVMHTAGTGNGERGFHRFWIPPQWIGESWEKCPCGWGGKTHYAHEDHVKWWHKQIKKLGSLGAAERTVGNAIFRSYPPAVQKMIRASPPAQKKRAA